jgi:ribonucleoside-diphosphate reductase alpha chain
MAAEETCAECARLATLVAELKARPPERRRLPDERPGFTKRIHLRHREGDLKIYVSTGTFPDGTLGELFIKADKAGSTISGLLDSLSVTASLALQHGVPIETIVEKWGRMQFDPSGTTTDPDMRQVSSIVDAVARWLHSRYAKKDASDV